MSFAITVLPAVAGHRLVCVEGAVDASTAADVRGVLHTAISRMPTRRLTIDLREAHVDEAGRRCLTEVAAFADSVGVQVRTVDSVASAPAAPAMCPTVIQQAPRTMPALV